MYADVRRNIKDQTHQKRGVPDGRAAAEVDFHLKEARYSLSSPANQGSGIHFASLSPIEKGFFSGVENGNIGPAAMQELYTSIAVSNEKKIQEWFQKYFSGSSPGKKMRSKIVHCLPSHLTAVRVSYLQNGNYDYFEELKRQYKFYKEGQTQVGYTLVHSGEEVSTKALEANGTPSILFSIDGIHSLGVGNPEDEATTEVHSAKNVSTGKLKSRIRQIKGEETLDDDEIKKWEHPPLFMRLANNFGNGLFGHARHFNEAAQTVLDQRRCADKGVIQTCGYDIACELLGLDEHLQPTGSRRILIDMQQLSANARNDLYQKIFRRFNKNISPQNPIPVIFSKAAYSGVDFLAEMARNARDGMETENFRVQGYYGGSINLSDEDILEVFWSHGLISLSLEENRLGDELAGFEKLFSNSARSQAIRLLTRQLEGIVSVPFAYNLNNPFKIWECLNIGAGLTGNSEYLERYRPSIRHSTLEEDLEEALTRLKKEEPLWFGGYRPDALVRKICHENMVDFVQHHF